MILAHENTPTRLTTVTAIAQSSSPSSSSYDQYSLLENLAPREPGRQPVIFSAPSAPPGRRLRRQAIGALAAVLLLAAAGWLAWEALWWPDVAALATRRPATTAFIERYRHGGGWFADPRQVEWRWVRYSPISANLKRPVLLGADMRFFSHDGFQRREIRQA